ncbi:MAG: hypothetical protein ATN36_04865 [Epulopiscium sp. Nele67-Bin005]|nr:MAG: hypothetical protein ATN36_04865 [Epulopiscium sp. Nele67-Bin005]
MESAVDLVRWKEEKIENKVYYICPSANPRHSQVIDKLYLRFGVYLEQSKEGKKCRAFTDHIDVYLDEGKAEYVVPDLSILCDRSKFKPNGYHGVPTLIVEVISPTSIKHDTVTKFNLYEKYGVKEYWLVDYMSQSIKQYFLHKGKYQLMSVIVVLDEYDLKRLTQIEKDNYTTIIKPTIFESLEIDVSKIFEDLY